MTVACLDIETGWDRGITVVGIHRPDAGTRQWVRPRFAVEEMRRFLEGVEVFYTYNGSRFDLPVLQRQLGVDFAAEVPHRDLMLDCWRQNLYGGLKAVERTLGLHRDTEGVDGLMAMRLWERFEKRGDKDALEVLLRYNREDIENLVAVARRLGVLTGAGR